MKDWLIAARNALALSLAFVTIASTLFPARWHEVTW